MRSWNSVRNDGKNSNIEMTIEWRMREKFHKWSHWGLQSFINVKCNQYGNRNIHFPRTHLPPRYNWTSPGPPTLYTKHALLSFFLLSNIKISQKGNSSTSGSQVVTYPSTRLAWGGLTSRSGTRSGANRLVWPELIIVGWEALYREYEKREYLLYRDILFYILYIL